MSRRRLSDVIDSMMECCPWAGHPFFIRLQSVRESLSFAAPEVEHLFWNKVLDLLMEHIAPENPDDIDALLAMEDWKRNVLMEFNPEMRKLFKD